MGREAARRGWLVAPLAVAVFGNLGALAIILAWLDSSRDAVAWTLGLLVFSLIAVVCSIAYLAVHAVRAAKDHDLKKSVIEEALQALDSVSDGVIVYDPEWRFIFLNRSAVEVAGRPRDALIGRVLWEEYPELVGGDLHRRYLASRAEGQSTVFEYYSEPTRQWLELRLFPTETRVTVVLRDVSQQHAALAQLEAAKDRVALELASSEEIARSLQEANRKLGERNRQLQEFAHIASHDLQEPLRKIRIFGEMLQGNSLGLGELGRDYLDRMLAASARMQTLLVSLLAFARVGTQRPAEVQVDLGKVLNQIAADMFIERGQAQPEISIGSLPTVVGDPVLLRQAFHNLVSNAAKFVKPGDRPHIEIGCEYFDVEGEAWCRIFVQDRGIGFEPEEAEQIFGLFQRLHGRSTYEGSGIGLAIVRRVAEHHGGRVSAKGMPGQGARFEVELPLESRSRESPT